MVTGQSLAVGLAVQWSYQPAPKGSLPIVMRASAPEANRRLVVGVLSEEAAPGVFKMVTHGMCPGVLKRHGTGMPVWLGQDGGLEGHFSDKTNGPAGTGLSPIRVGIAVSSSDLFVQIVAL
jgi:hypothetical protein